MSSEIAPTTLPGYPAHQQQPSEGGFYLLPGACPSFPVQQQPTLSAVHNTNTTVVIQQQPAAVIVQQQRDWSTGIYDCFDDCGVCLLGWLCPCILQCMVSNKAGKYCGGLRSTVMLWDLCNVSNGKRTQPPWNLTIKYKRQTFYLLKLFVMEH
ncbi:Hypothetical predicted protein [Paramuricea clavata]|uniref:Uncharacterized protein n=1 Tax=Paramuricea clavata TaxID=317549 RepID=A0A7D9L4D1_PARCT|nr:Hypothetical predicted protein [Paramuricea clavata]